MGRISPGEMRDAVEGLEPVKRQFHHVEITPDLVTSAGDLAKEMALRAYDAIQLAAALSLDTDDLVVVTGDQQLRRLRKLSGWLPSPTRRHRHEFGSERAPGQE